MKYRPEIDGLRAISVLAVMLFHLNDKMAPGGFVGVDVFFVISGYLITSLICSERAAGRFSLLAFYLRRIKRIAPALFATVLATMVAGYLILSPGDYYLLARSGLFTLGGASNFFFAANTGYFDPEAATMPLLHTWSLGVEEQFYVVWPGLLLILWRLSKRIRISMLASMSVLIGASLAAYHLTDIADPKAAFYMPYTRAWELGLGGIIPFLPHITSRLWSSLKTLLPWLGLALIGAAALSFAAATTYAWIAITAAALGGFFVIYATEPLSFVYRILSSGPFVFIGKISYSLYLFHFPMIVLWRHYAGTSATQPEYYLPFFAGAVLLAGLSWRYIEQPCRSGNWNWKAVIPAFGVAELALGCLCMAVILTDGAAARIPLALIPLRSREAMWTWECPQKISLGTDLRCAGGADWDKAAAHAVIWGDSNSLQFMPLLDIAGRDQNVSIVNLYTCAPVVATGYFVNGSASQMAECDRQNSEALRDLNSTSVNLIILAASWANVAGNRLVQFKTALDRLLAAISTTDKTIAIISEVPKWADDPVPCVMSAETRLLRSASFRRGCQDAIENFDRTFFDKFEQPADEILRSFTGKDGVIVWSPVDDLCSARACTAFVNDEFIFLDGRHLRSNLKELTKLDLAQLLRFGELLKLAKKGANEH
jgi:peptidoglycan/LPS O-acetylase OafA/YrhL